MALAARALAFLLLWIVVAGPRLSDLPVGVAAALLAGWASLRLWPTAARRVNVVSLALFALRLVALAVLSGIAVARRALDPRASVRPGLVAVPLVLPEGGRRDLFLTLMATVPGTIPSGADAGGAVMVHCLDTAEPVAADFAQEEALFRRAIGG